MLLADHTGPLAKAERRLEDVLTIKFEDCAEKYEKLEPITVSVNAQLF